MKVPYTSFKKIISENKVEYTNKFLKTLDFGNTLVAKNVKNLKVILQSFVM